jgi:HEAT repeat protein
MSRIPTILLALPLAAAAAILAPPPAQAQSLGGFGPAAQERYNRKTKGVANLDEFVRRLESDDADDRLQAVRSLGESGDDKATEYLIQAAGDEDVRVKAKAIDMLGHMRATQATPVLIQYLFLRTTDPQMKSLILAALGKIGDERAARPIIEFLQRDLDGRTRGTAIFALGEIGSSDSEEVLAAVLESQDDRSIRRLANEALVKVKNRRAAVSQEANGPTDVFLRRDDQPPDQQ